MATIQSTLVLQDKMSSVFNNINKAGKDSTSSLKGVKGAVDDVKNGMLSGTSASNTFFKSLMSFSLVRNIFGMITSQVSSAISRLDTLNNYPKVMQNLGIAQDQANASRERLSEGLKGIPTTLDDAVLAVQRFTSVNNNVGASTEMFLALNNAILAGRSKYNDTTIST